MNAHTGITAAVDAETLAMAERAAAQRGMSLAAYAAEAIQRVAESDADLDAFIQVGIDAADRGELVPQSEVMAELDRMIAKHRARCQR